jgi:hypothetical protein
MNFIAYNFGLKEAWDGLVGKKPKKENFIKEYLKNEQSNRAATEHMLAANAGTKEGAKAYKDYLKSKDPERRIKKSVKAANKIINQFAPKTTSPTKRLLNKLHKMHTDNLKAKGE